MCFGGGSSGASDRAEARETERLAEIERATRAIDAAFTGREGQQQDFVGALRDFLTADVRKQKTVADRRAKFSLARAGLTGGSTAADVGTDLGEEFTEGILGAERQSQSRLADLRASDEASRTSLLGLAQAGLSSTTAAERAASSIQSNLAGARASGFTEGVGDVFGGTAQLFKQQEEAAARRKGLRESEVFANPFSRT